MTEETTIKKSQEQFPNATPRPWRYQGWDSAPGDAGAYILGGGPDGSMDEHMVGAALPQPTHRNRAECEDNALLMIAAVNSYDALREAAEAALKWFAWFDDVYNTGAEVKVANKLYAALVDTNTTDEVE